MCHVSWLGPSFRAVKPVPLALGTLNFHFSSSGPEVPQMGVSSRHVELYKCLYRANCPTPLCTLYGFQTTYHSCWRTRRQKDTWASTWRRLWGVLPKKAFSRDGVSMPLPMCSPLPKTWKVANHVVPSLLATNPCASNCLRRKLASLVQGIKFRHPGRVVSSLFTWACRGYRYQPAIYVHGRCNISERSNILICNRGQNCHVNKSV